MIHVFLKDHTKNFWQIMLSHEINNEFLFDLDQYTKNNIIKWWHLDIWLSDFNDVEFPLEKLDKLYNDFDILEKNIDEIIWMIPLPKKIWGFDWYYWDWYVSILEWWKQDFKKYFPEVSDEKIENMINYWNLIDNVPDNYTKNFTKQDMLLIISLIKKKILEAKEKNETLVFSGD